MDELGALWPGCNSKPIPKPQTGEVLTYRIISLPRTLDNVDKDVVALFRNYLANPFMHIIGI